MPTAAGRVKDATAGVVGAPRRVPFDAPWEWLAAGWRDLWAMPQISLTYGAVFAIAAASLALGLSSLGGASLFLALAGGFLLIAPFVAVGLYDASRLMAKGETPTLSGVVSAAFRAQGQLAFLGVALLLLFMAWMQLAFLLLMLFLGSAGLPPPSDFMHVLLFTPRGLGLLVTGSIVGGLIALLVFAVTTVSVPMLLEARLDAVTAMKASLEAVRANPRAMMLWAALIVVIMGAGFVMLLAGLAISFPLVAHATWHAYADIYGKPAQP